MTAWDDYLAAAQRLDAVRRGAAAAVAEQTGATKAAQGELAAIRERLRAEHARFVQAGVPAEHLAPAPEQIAAAAGAMAGGPVAVRDALRRTQSTVDAAAAALIGGAAGRPGRTALSSVPLWLRNLLVYGPFALVVLVIQVALYLVADQISVSAALCALAMPAAAFGLGWVAVGIAFPGEPAPGGGRQPVRRTPLFGALVCLAPTVLTCGVFGLLSLAG